MPLTKNICITDRNHFDNPVYSYQGSGKRDDDCLLNNTTLIKNNLHKQTNTNLEKQRLGIAAGCCSTDDDDLSSKGKFMPWLFNFSIDWHYFVQVRMKWMENWTLWRTGMPIQPTQTYTTASISWSTYIQKLNKKMLKILVRKLIKWYFSF